MLFWITRVRKLILQKWQLLIFCPERHATISIYLRRMHTFIRRLAVMKKPRTVWLVRNGSSYQCKEMYSYKICRISQFYCSFGHGLCCYAYLTSFLIRNSIIYQLLACAHIDVKVSETEEDERHGGTMQKYCESAQPAVKLHSNTPIESYGYILLEAFVFYKHRFVPRLSLAF